MATRLHVRWYGVQIYVRPGSGHIQLPTQWIAGVEHFGHATDHSTPSRTQVKNKWSYTSTCLYAFKVKTGTTSPFLSNHFKLTKWKLPHLHPSLVLEANLRKPGDLRMQSPSLYHKTKVIIWSRMQLLLILISTHLYQYLPLSKKQRSLLLQSSPWIFFVAQCNSWVISLQCRTNVLV